MRAYFEALENEILAPYALRSAESAGRRVEEPASKTRTCFQRDRDRIIHSKAFRRLKHKTQVFVALESDHYRTRLTHTLEVAQISRHIARVLRSNEDVAEAIALAHDLGHPPFAHAGEVVMDEMMKGHGGFEHNMQSLRVVDTLEDKYPNVPGLNLSQEIREGLMKHQSPWDQAGKEMIFPSIEAQVVNLSDQIAYNNHDIDDGLESGILTESGLSQNVQLWRAAETHIREQYSQLEDVHRLRE